MSKIVVNLQVPLGTLQVASIYVPYNRVKRAKDVAILRLFDMKVVQVRLTPAQNAELKRLDERGATWTYFFGIYFSRGIIYLLRICYLYQDFSAPLLEFLTPALTPPSLSLSLSPSL